MKTAEAIQELEFILVGHPETSARGQAVLMAIEALEKQIPKKLILDTGTYARRCPSCSHTVSGFYCWNCGQHLSWKGNEKVEQQDG